MVISTFKELIVFLREFVNEREWNKYHKPRNLSLALTGECGELSEIFQWKEDDISQDISQDISKEKNINLLSNEELIHLGEEISDVFIYNLRLSDLCEIDIILAIKHILYQNNPSNNNNNDNNNNNNNNNDNNNNNYEEINFKQQIINDLSFQDALILINNSIYFKINSLRDILFYINSAQGEIAYLFGNYGVQNSSIDTWSSQDIYKLSTSIAKIAILLITLTSKSNLNLANIISDKLQKNAAKYPVNLVRGSSKKYTYYYNKLFPKLFSFKSRTFSSIIIFSFGFMSSIFLLTGYAITQSIESMTVDV